MSSTHPDSSALKIRRQRRRFYVRSAVTAALVIGIAVFATLIAYRISWTYDMSAGKVFTLSEQTRQAVAALAKPVEIIAVYPTGGADPMVSALLDEYAKAGPQMSVQYVDAERDPTRLARLNLSVPAMQNGTVIVRSPDKTKLLNQADMFQQTADGNAFWGERELTGAIRYVTAGDVQTVYFLEGHDEASTSADLAQAAKALQLDVYNPQPLSLLRAGGVPKDAAAVVIASPKKDLSDTEAQMLNDYLAKGGKALFLVDAMSTNSVVLGNFNKLLHPFGVDITNNVVVEEDPNSHVGNNNLYLIPGYTQHPITSKLAESKRYVILPIAMGLHTLDYDQQEVKLEPLLATTPQSWMRSDMSATLGTKTATDVPGPIPMAYAATRAGSGNDDARVVVVGNSTFINNSNLDAYANRDFFLNAINWLAGRRGADAISPRIIGADKLIVRGSDFTRLLIICLVVLPMIPFAGAFVIWRLRRNM